MTIDSRGDGSDKAPEKAAEKVAEKVAAQPVKKVYPIQDAVAKALADIVYEATESGDKPAIWISAADALKVCQIVKEHPDLELDYLSCLSGMDYPDEFQVIYHLYSTTKKHWLVVKAKVSKEEPVIDSAVSVWLGADWHEREATDMFGITFKGHPFPKVLLLREDADFHPLLKSFKLPDYPPVISASEEK